MLCMAASDYERIEKTIRYLEANFRAQPSLAEVAAQAQLSEYHFQRLFRRWAGISPKRFLQALTAEYARNLLRASRNVLEVSDAAGLSSGGRLHDLLVTLHAVTPGEIQERGANLTIQYGFHPSPFGEFLLAKTARGICCIEFVASEGRDATLANVRRQWPAADWRLQPRATKVLAQKLFSNSQERFDLWVRGSNFQIKVWQALLRIPRGSVAAYEDLAARIEAPSATRAVASAVACNPVAILIPCHRVIRKTGAFGEYRWGSTRKKALLGWEAVQALKLSDDES